MFRLIPNISLYLVNFSSSYGWRCLKYAIESWICSSVLWLHLMWWAPSAGNGLLKRRAAAHPSIHMGRRLLQWKVHYTSQIPQITFRSWVVLGKLTIVYSAVEHRCTLFLLTQAFMKDALEKDSLPVQCTVCTVALHHAVCTVHRVQCSALWAVKSKVESVSEKGAWGRQASGHHCTGQRVTGHPGTGNAFQCKYAVNIKHESCASSGCSAQLYALECVISTQCKEQNGLPHLVTRSFLPRRDTWSSLTSC